MSRNLNNEKRLKERKKRNLERQSKNLQKRLVLMEGRKEKGEIRTTKSLIFMTKRFNEGKVKETKEVKRIMVFLKRWPDDSSKLQSEIKDLKSQIQKLLDEKAQIEIDIKNLLREIYADTSANDPVIMEAFSVNEEYVTAQERRNIFLKTQIFPFLHMAKEESPDGKRKKITITHSDNLHRVVVFVKDLHSLDEVLTEHALSQLQVFYDRLNERKPEKDDKYVVIFKLIQKAIVTRNAFNLGESFSALISYDFDKNEFPELVEAQKSLREAIISEESNPGIMLFERNNVNEGWKSRKQNPV